MKKLILLFGILLFGNKLLAPGMNLQSKFDAWRRVTSDYNDVMYQRELDLYVHHLGWVESRNNWKVVNKYGYMGTWQHGTKLLKDFGLDIKPDHFRADSSIFPLDVQYKVLISQIKVQTIWLRQFDKWIGSEINGVIISRAGMLAGCHLGGPGGVKNYLLSDGVIDKLDANGTKISDYLREFSIYKL